MLTPQEKNERMWAMLCHLAALAIFIMPPIGNIIGPLIVWLIKKNDYPIVDQQGKESLNFQITISVCMLALTIFSIVTLGFGVWLAAPIMTILSLTDLALTIIAAVKTNDGIEFHYPFSFKFIK